MNAYAAILSFTLQRKCIGFPVLKALDLAHAAEKPAAFAVIFFSRLLSECPNTVLQEIFEQLRSKPGSDNGPSDVVLAVEIFFQRHMRAAASGNEKLVDGVKRVLGMCREVALEV
jgi:hypothetical protein